MNTEDILEEIQYLKKKTVLLEKLLNTKQQNNTTLNTDIVLSNISNETENKTSIYSYKKRSIC